MSTQLKLVLAFQNATKSKHAPFNLRLAWYMKQHHVSIKELAAITGASSNTVDRWVSGEYEPRVSRIYSMCKRFKCTPNQLIGLNEHDFTITPRKQDIELWSVLSHNGQLSSKTVKKFAESVNFAQNGQVSKFEVFLNGCSEVMAQYEQWLNGVKLK
jgi:transcriptional regulator with XRE-family HTH domain